jgi:hypothetical protein
LLLLVSGLLLSGGQGRVHAQKKEVGSKHDFGFTAAFESELTKVGQITPEQFAQRFPGKAKYQSKLSWDPTTAKYWDRFLADPNDPKTGLRIRHATAEDRKNLFDFRLNDKELAILKDKGFVVSERLGSHSFTDLYYRAWVRDLPVYVSSDSMLHAWHRYFDRLLEGMEMDFFRPSIKLILAEMAAQIPAAKADYGAGPLAPALTDADFFLAVAGQLLEPKSVPSRLGQEKRVADALKACHDAGGMEDYELFGRDRAIDFSQFKPRGRYEEHERTQSYFRAMMWLGRIDFRIAGGESPEQDIRELSGAIVMNDLLRRARMAERWQQVDRALVQLVGKSDSLNFSQLGVILADAQLGPTRTTPEGLADLRTRILASKLGEQHIRGEWFQVNPEDPRKFVLPRTFAFMGQRFTLDSFALSKIVYDDISWTDVDRKVTKVQRRIPSSADVAFAVFGNDHLVSALTRRMKDPAGRKFRDGLNYQHNLAAVRNVIDRLPEGTWQESVYADWLGCLRELSRPTTDAKYPEAMRTSSWAMKATITQLASWTQLRHDTVLYAKPSYSIGSTCEYPAGFVEPVPHFWKRFEAMVNRTKAGIEKLKFPGAGDNAKEQMGRYTWRLEKFAKAASMLHSIAEKEVAQKELTQDETKFLKEIVVRDHNSCGVPPTSGWYPELFGYRAGGKDQDDAHKWAALVTDVHTNPPSLDRGCVLHQGVGNVDALLIAVDNGKDRMVYIGPVFSYYEFEAPGTVRHTDNDWHEMLRAGKAPPRPEWAAGFVAPGVNPEAKGYGKVRQMWSY